ncbi:MAG: family 43 glycosylhydrolase [Bacteroidales bacterium]|nr:family 43 glycosylhydrolase [Bacteroidales bacterium]
MTDRTIIKILICLIVSVTEANLLFAQNNRDRTIRQGTVLQKKDPPLLVQIHNPNENLYPAHDPVMIKQDSVYYLFTTGGGVASSTDMINWKREKNVFEQAPAWITQDLISGFRGGGGYWAPDIQFVNGTYYLYYSFSAFAKNTSVIGVATNKTLHPADTNFKWVDHGMVIQSIPNKDMWNAIDPNLIMDGRQGWLAFGSFWDGIKMVKLAPDLLSVAKPEVWYTLARQPRTFALDDTDPGDGTIEAPFIFKRFQYFYLFISVDYCCRGLNSDYKVLVGRSRTVEGPYVDREGNLLTRGGGMIVAQGNVDWAAVGHCAAYTFNGKTYLIMHGYDKYDNGRSKLIVKEIKWDRAEWPTIDL